MVIQPPSGNSIHEFIVQSTETITVKSFMQNIADLYGYKRYIAMHNDGSPTNGTYFTATIKSNEMQNGIINTLSAIRKTAADVWGMLTVTAASTTVILNAGEKFTIYGE